MKKTMLLVSAFMAGSALALPRVSNVQVTMRTAGRMTISYTLTGGPAVVTLDVKTNSSAWASIGIDALVGANPDKPGLKGDVFRRVSGDGPHTIDWNAYKAWGAAGGRFTPGEVKFEVKAHPLYDAPDYLVTDLRAGVTAADRVKYFPSEDFLPGGLLSNPAYRTTHLVLRRIHARNVRYTQGVTTEGKLDADKPPFYEQRETVEGIKGNENVHRVTLPNDFYIGVFEITQAQWTHVTGKNVSYYNASPESPMRPAEQLSYARLREAVFNCSEADGKLPHPNYSWPRPPHPDSFLGKLRALTSDEFDYDLPGDVEWEFACRAGLPEGYWNDGSDAKDSSLIPGRCNENGGWLPDGTSYPNIPSLGPTNATAVCGSYPPNRWGLYDMHGNVQEWCVDWFQWNYREGKININPNDPMQTLGGAPAEGLSYQRARRGGSFNTKAFEPANGNDCRASARSGYQMGAAYVNYGGRVACRAGLR